MVSVYKQLKKEKDIKMNIEFALNEMKNNKQILQAKGEKLV